MHHGLTGGPVIGRSDDKILKILMDRVDALYFENQALKMPLWDKFKLWVKKRFHR